MAGTTRVEARAAHDHSAVVYRLVSAAAIQNTSMIWHVKNIFDDARYARYQEGTLLVLLCLAEHANKSATCWPTQPTLAKRTRMTVRQVRNILNKLETDGALHVEHGRGRGLRNRYELVWENGNSSSPFPARKKGKLATEKGNWSSGHNKVPIAEALELAGLLRSLILRNNPTALIKDGNWLLQADRMLRLDHRSADESRELLVWSQDHPFWMANILSMKKFRLQFDQLKMQKQRGGNGYGNRVKQPCTEQNLRALDEFKREQFRVINGGGSGGAYGRR